MINRQSAVSVIRKKKQNPDLNNHDLFLSNRELYQNSLLQWHTETCRNAKKMHNASLGVAIDQGTALLSFLSYYHI